MLLHLEDVVQFCQEPLVDISYLPDFVNAISPVESRRNRKDTFIRWVHEFLVYVLDKIILRTSDHE